MSANSSPVEYALGHSEAETQRLIRQGQIYGPLTRQFFQAAGITAGMRVFDIGSGAGDVALLAADLVGPLGSVVGVDVNADILERARERIQATGWTNVRFIAGELGALDTLDLGGPFDAVVGRWVLMYLPDPAAMLRRLVTHLRPGGIVAFQEIDFTSPPMTFPAQPLFELVNRWVIPQPGPRPPGAPDPQMGLRLYQAFLDAGLPAPQMRLEAPIGGGADWPGYAYLADTVRSLLPFLQRMGMTPPEVLEAWGDLDTLADRLRAEAVGARGIQTLPNIIGAWARRP